MSPSLLRIYSSLLTLLRHPNYYLRIDNTQITSNLYSFHLILIPSHLQHRSHSLLVCVWLQCCQIENYFVRPVDIIKQIAKFRKMDLFEPKRSRSSRFNLQVSEEEYSFSSANPQKSVKATQQQFQVLFVARERFNNFVNELGEQRYSEIREDILSHCQQNTKR